MCCSFPEPYLHYDAKRIQNTFDRHKSDRQTNYLHYTFSLVRSNTKQNNLVTSAARKHPTENNLAVLLKELDLKHFMNTKGGQGCHAGMGVCTQRNNAFDYTNS
jgi:hypothetical protein